MGQVCPWESIATRVYLYLNPKYFLDSMIGTASWSTGVMGEEQSETQIKKWLAWVPPPPRKSKGTQERAVRRGAGPEHLPPLLPMDGYSWFHLHQGAQAVTRLHNQWPSLKGDKNQNVTLGLVFMIR